MKARIIRMQRKQSIAGFTLLEMLVVVFMIAILFAIAAPSWDALMNRQRVNTVREQATQIIRQAQSQARTNRRSMVVIFDPNASISPRAAIQPLLRDTTTGQTSSTVINPADPTITNWQTLGGGDVKAGNVEFSTFPAAASNQIAFDSSGFVDQVSINRVSPSFGRNAESASSRIFGFTVKPKGASPATNRCVIVKTILGGVELGEGNTCS